MAHHSSAREGAEQRGRAASMVLSGIYKIG
jgi:hypothetical protein